MIFISTIIVTCSDNKSEKNKLSRIVFVGGDITLGMHLNKEHAFVTKIKNYFHSKSIYVTIVNAAIRNETISMLEGRTRKLCELPFSHFVISYNAFNQISEANSIEYNLEKIIRTINQKQPMAKVVLLDLDPSRNKLGVILKNILTMDSVELVEFDWNNQALNLEEKHQDLAEEMIQALDR